VLREEYIIVLNMTIKERRANLQLPMDEVSIGDHLRHRVFHLVMNRDVKIFYARTNPTPITVSYYDIQRQLIVCFLIHQNAPAT